MLMQRIAKKFNRKKLILLLVIQWVFLVSLYKYHYSFNEENIFGGTHNDQHFSAHGIEALGYASKLSNYELSEDESIKRFMALSHRKDERNLTNPSQSIIYDYMLKEHNISSIINLSMEERCDLYFTTLFLLDPDWFLDPNEDLKLQNRMHFRYHEFKSSKWKEAENELIKVLGVNSAPSDQMIEKKIKEKYDEWWVRNQIMEQKLTNSVSHMKIYNKCYVSSADKDISNTNSNFVSEQKSLIKDRAPFFSSKSEKLIKEGTFKRCSNTEKRLYPWLSLEFPIYERWTGEISMSPPEMSKYLKGWAITPTNAKKSKSRGRSSIKSKITNNNNGCFLPEFKKSLNGKGIVLTIGNQHLDEAIRLIHLLRALQNQLPIQFVSKDPLTKETKMELVKAARQKYVVLPTSFNRLLDIFPADYFKNIKKSGLPQQEIWFVNVNHAIDKQYMGKFQAYSNKFLAAFFNSFEEYMLIDVDTVLLKGTEYFFNLEGYKNFGAYFYRDRAIQQFSPKSDGIFFQKLTPSIMDSFIFNFELPHKSKWEYDYFKHGLYHHMESGLVLIDRNIHFNPALIMVHINFYNLVTERVWGDKEIFWLSFLIAGENFIFNPHNTATIGEESSSRKLTHKSREICSSHPGHLSEDAKSLDWINSGFRFCGKSDKVNYDEEFQRNNRYSNILSVGQFKQFYEGRLNIKQAIVPPYTNVALKNVDDEPEWPWMLDNAYCSSYMWCGYNSIGGNDNNGNSNRKTGIFVDFNQDDVDFWTFLGDIWLGIKQD